MPTRFIGFIAGFVLWVTPLTGAPIITGTVLGSDGQPLSGALVRLLPVLPGFETHTLLLSGRTTPEPIGTTSADANGRYTLAAPGQGIVKVVVEAAGYVSMQYAPLPLVESIELPPIALNEAEPALVEVVDDGGVPVPGVWVTARPTAGSAWKGRTADGWRVASRWGSTDSRGRLALPRAVFESLDLVALVPTSFLAAGARRVEGARLVLSSLPQSTLEIEVREPDGRPAGEMIVTLGDSVWPVGRTDRDGKLLLDRRAPERLKVRLFSPDGRQHAGWLEKGTERAVFQLGKPAQLAGRVVEARTQRPIPGALVWAGHDPGSFARTDGDGRYDLVAPTTERWWVQAEAAEFRSVQAWAKAADVDGGRMLSLALVPTAAGSGRIVDSAGRPLGAVEITATALSTDSEPPAFRLDTVDSRTVSDSHGRFRLSGLQPGTGYRIEAHKKGFAPRLLPSQRLPLDAPTGGIVDLGRLVLLPAVRMEGRVIDTNGRPIQGAGVWRLAESPTDSAAQPPRTAPLITTKPDGRFALEDLAQGEQVHLLVYHSDYLPLAIPALRAQIRQPLDVVLRPAERLVGWVMDTEGMPVAGAAVTLRPETPPAGVVEPSMAGRREIQATVEPSGRFQLDSVKPGRYGISAIAEGFQSSPVVRLVIGSVAPLEELRFVLEHGAVVSGRVLNGDGEPVSGARVVLGQAEDSADESGSYRLEGLAPGPGTIEARHRAYGRVSRAVTIDRSTNALDLRFPNGQRLSGRVLDDFAKPVPGAHVTLRPAAPADDRELELVAGAVGQFAFPQVTEGVYQLSAEKAGLISPEPLHVEVADGPVEGLELTMSRGATLVGRISGLSADELAEARVSAEREEGGQATGWADVTGHYETQGLAPGTWHVRAALQNGAREASGVVEIPPGARSATLDLEFRRGLTLSGRILYSGTPLAGASVTVTEHSQSSARQVRTSYEGRFRLLDLEPGWYRVEVTHPAELLTEVQDLHLVGDEEVTIDITTAQVSGHVVSASGEEPLADALVALQRLLGAGDAGLLAVGTDSRGSFRLARVTAGRYRLTIQKPGYAPLVQELEVQAVIELGTLELAPAP